ncbi:hypothetical protein [Lentzea sp. HUAS12]|uniref:hypothetical protein n=1 Tax=Lentzea sp. HUAS12 TaxID=2951806 RepID=UPI0020A1A1C7|nr:hypothetical protein [Lentzea sp. HUAS12]USX49922.1 hypothetical protein ND450_31600 [Lentzea sp. HUAS12]
MPVVNGKPGELRVQLSLSVVTGSANRSICAQYCSNCLHLVALVRDGGWAELARTPRLTRQFRAPPVEVELKTVHRTAAIGNTDQEQEVTTHERQDGEVVVAVLAGLMFVARLVFVLDQAKRDKHVAALRRGRLRRFTQVCNA